MTDRQERYAQIALVIFIMVLFALIVDAGRVSEAVIK